MGIGERVHNGAGQVRSIAVAEQRPVSASVENIGERFQIRGDDPGACGHSLHEHDPEGLTAGLRRHIARCRSEQGRLIRIRNATEEGHGITVSGQGGALGLGLTTTGDEEAGCGNSLQNGRNGRGQHLQSFSGFIQTPQESDRGCLGRAEEARVVLGGGGERSDIDAVGDHHGVTAVVLNERAARLLGHGDASSDPLHERRCGRGEQLTGQGTGQGGVKSPHHRAGRGLQGKHADVGSDRLVDVKQIEVVALKPATGPAGHDRTEVEAGDRAVVRDGDRIARGGDPIRKLGVGRGRRQHPHVMTPAAQLGGQIHDMGLHSSVRVQRVRADDANLHAPASCSAWLRARRSWSRSASKTGWSMCQSMACFASSGPMTAAQARVCATTRSRMLDP